MNDALVRRIATTATVLSVAVVALTVAAMAIPSVRTRLGLLPSTPPSYRVGERIDVPDRVYGGSPLTLVVFVRSNCAACQSARPALKHIADRLQRTSARVALVTNGDREESDLAFAGDLGLDRAHVIPLDFSALRLHVVPTLVLVNRRGDVLYASQGVPSPKQQEELLRVAGSQSFAG